MNFSLQSFSRIRVIAGVAMILVGALPQVGMSDTHSLYLSNEVIDFRDFGKDLDGSNETITEKLDDLVYPENKKRKEWLAARDVLEPTGEDVPRRQSLFGDQRFLRPGRIDNGTTLRSGATWRSAFMVYGTFRTALQAYNSDTLEFQEWTNRLDLFGNLALSGSERVFIGFRPLDDEGKFTGYTFSGGTVPSGFDDARNFEPRIFFMEGDLGEVFPNLDPDDSRHLDYQFSIGRQGLSFQDGIMINDIVDGVGLTRHNTFLLGASAAKITAFVGLNEIHRGDNRRSSGSKLFLLSSWFDYSDATIEFETAYVTGDSAYGGDGFYLGLGRLGRWGYWNSTLRGNASFALENETAAVGTGALFTHELSRTTRYSDDVFYLNTFLGVDHYTSAARGPATGGPLGRLAFLNRAVGLGKYGAPLGNGSGDVVGMSVGYQHFLDAEGYRSVLFELGGRTPYAGGEGPSMLGFGLRYQQTLTRQAFLVIDGAVTLDEDGNTAHGGRAEVQVKF